jgi:hypothetical protein
MEFLHASIALLASMVLVLAGMVGWLYWQQTRIFQNMNSIVMVIGELARPVYPAEEETPTAPPSSPEPEKQEQEEEDDRVSVEEQEESGEGVQTVDGPMDTDNLDEKTIKDLRDLLTKRGIPFGKRDTKSALISLLKATS